VNAIKIENYRNFVRQALQKLGIQYMKYKHIRHILAVTTIVGGILAADAAAIPVALLRKAEQAFEAYRPGVSGFKAVSIKKATADSRKRTVTLTCSNEATYLPLTQESLEALRNACLDSLGNDYAGYKLRIIADGHELSELILGIPRNIKRPTEKNPFICRQGAPAAPAGLDGTNIAMWQSHGWYFEPKLNRWEWQRARIFQTVEDLYTQSYVIPFLMPMLENAGAYVMSPRERDVNTTEIIIDNDGGLAEGFYDESQGTREWSDAPAAGFAHLKEELHENYNPFRAGTARVTTLSGDATRADATAVWSADIPADGTYAIYVSYTSMPNSTTAAHYRVNAANGPHDFTVNQRMGGGTWIYLGHFPLRAGSAAIVELSNAGTDGKASISADAVKIGGGYGNVARIVKEPRRDGISYSYVRSGYPRFTEGARYFLQWAGAPDSVYTESDNVNDYGDDYRSRGLWVNWLAGGSSVLPDAKGLNIPVDLSFAFHSDAGTTMNDSIIGTLGIYCTEGKTTAGGTDRMASRDLTDMVMTAIVNDVRATFEPDWTRRGMWDKSYAEARMPEVPAMLLELLSHQNFADMSYGLDPAFRFTVSRAIYKGILRFLAARDGRGYVVQPLPVRNFAIATTAQPERFRLSWAERVDSLEATATPSYYIIEERTGDTAGGFREIARTTDTHYDATVDDKLIHSYRIIAANDGGCAFPSEVLALCRAGSGEPVLVVNGFTRVSAPDRFDAGDIAGFYDTKDHGVAYVQDISYIGSQFEFRRNIPWMDDDAAGFGASRADFETRVIAGNTFDFVYRHGEAISAAGHPFISSSVEAFCDAPGAGAPRIVDLILGKQKEYKPGRGAYGTRYKAFPAELQTRIKAHTDAGGDIFVSGAYVASDIWDNPYSDKSVAEADKAFARNVLGYIWRVGQASVGGEVYQVPTPFKAFGSGSYRFSNNLYEDCYAVESPDSFYASDPERGATLMRYGENNLVAATAFNATSYRTVVLGFPFECILDGNERADLMRQILGFFSDTSISRTKAPAPKKAATKSKKGRKSSKKRR